MKSIIDDTVILTVFTPVFNRAHTLIRTYESLLRQGCKRFIWLIVDDGSTDNTADLVKEWLTRDNGFEIRYVYKENGGMHTAHNTAYENINTELNVCIDSDDMMSEGAVYKILQKWTEIRDKSYAGIIGLDADFSGKIIGSGFPEGMEETTLCDYYSKVGNGDKKLVYRTDIVKQYPPYPVFEGEKYVSLSYKYRLIDQDYKMCVLNEILCNVEYQAEGSSRNMFRQYIANPKGFAFWRKVRLEYPESITRSFIDCIHYISSSILSKNRHFFAESPQKFLTVLAIPFGVVLTIYILMKSRGTERKGLWRK